MNSDKFLIRMMTWEKDKNYPTMVKGFYSKNITELLNLYYTAKEKEIEIQIPIEYEDYSSKFDGETAYVESIEIIFGGHTSMTCLDVYVKIV